MVVGAFVLAARTVFDASVSTGQGFFEGSVFGLVLGATCSLCGAMAGGSLAGSVGVLADGVASGYEAVRARKIRAGLMEAQAGQLSDGDGALSNILERP